MTTMVENEKSSTEPPDQPSRGIEAGFGSAAARFDKVEADMREGFARVDQDIRDLRAEMNTRFLALSADFNGLQHTMIGSVGAIVAALIGVKIF